MTEGPVHDRSREKLAESDKGIILYRRLLREQMEKVAEGVDPMNVFRDPAKAERITLVQDAFESLARMSPGVLQSNQAKYSPALEELFGKGAASETKSARWIVWIRCTVNS